MIEKKPCQSLAFNVLNYAASGKRSSQLSWTLEWKWFDLVKYGRIGGNDLWIDWS